MSTVAERLTADAYLAREDPRRTELIDGTVVVNEPGILHQHVCGLIYHALTAWTRGRDGRGMATLPLNVPLDEGNVLAPDVLWFDGELPLDAANAPRAPDLAVEARSPGTRRYAARRKRALAEAPGAATPRARAGCASAPARAVVGLPTRGAAACSSTGAPAPSSGSTSRGNS